jgi:hypothetical protein
VALPHALAQVIGPLHFSGCGGRLALTLQLPGAPPEVYTLRLAAGAPAAGAGLERWTRSAPRPASGVASGRGFWWLLRCVWTYLVPKKLDQQGFSVTICGPEPDNSKRIVLVVVDARLG